MSIAWNTAKMADVFNLQMGKTPDRSNAAYWNGSETWVAIGDMGDSRYISSSKEMISTKAVSASGIKRVPMNTVIMSFKLSVGKVAIAASDLFTNEAIMAFNVKTGYELVPEYIYYYLKGYRWQGSNRAVMGVTLNKASISQGVFKYPDYQEQQRIVAELDLLTSVIEKRKMQLKELDTLAQSIFYDMFGDPTHNEKGWIVKNLGMLGDLARGVSKYRPRNAPELLGGTMPLIQTGDVANSDYKIRKYSSTYSELGVAQSRVWPKGTLCITIAATIGKSAILDFDACFPDSVVGFTPYEQVACDYILFIFRNMQKMLEEYAPGVAQKNINLAILNELKIPVPPLALQQEFADKIQSIEKQKAAVNQSIAETQTLLDYTMDKYFG